ncbi:MAG: outer membrane protein transport protein, partial [Thermodesulfobacteriota bacterium]|nr:outer membrane protein transport protein [Thermodesulfobacteriota bacterium]
TGTNNNLYTSTDKDRIDLAPSICYAHNNKHSPWSWGLSLSVPDAVNTDYTIQSKYFGPVNGFSQILHIKFGPVVAYQVTPNLYVGTRLSIDHSSADLRMPVGLAYIDIGECSAFGLSGSVGILYKPTEKLNLGLYYEAPTMMKDLESKNADGYLSLMSPAGRIDFSNLDVTLNDMQFSQNLGIGLAYRPSRAWRLSADVRYFSWHKDWKDLEIVYSGASAAAMTAAGVPTTIKIPTNVSNQVTFGLGVEHFFGEIYTVSAGYHHAHDAMSDNYMLPFIPATMEHTITCGFSVRPSATIKMGISLMYGIWADPSAGPYHGYDQSLEMQLGLPPGSLDSEYNGATTDRTMRNIQLSFSVYW